MDMIRDIQQREHDQIMRASNKSDRKQAAIKIISDGTQEGTYIVNVYSGKKINAEIDSVNWYLDQNGFSRAIVIFRNIEIEVRATAIIGRK